MTKKEKFIEMVDKLITDEILSGGYEDALEYFEMFKSVKESDKPKFTENGKKILVFMQENADKYNNLFKAKEIGEGLSISSRTASGALRKIVSDGYVEKMGSEPVVYILTEKGKTVNLLEEPS